MVMQIKLIVVVVGSNGLLMLKNIYESLVLVTIAKGKIVEY